jgi:large subunit ribosomal protein L6
MSRLGKVPVALPQGVKVRGEGKVIHVEGPKGKLEAQLVDGIGMQVDEGGVTVTRRDDTRQQRASQGLIRSLVTNMVHGVSEGYTRVLEINGVGYRADAKGDQIHLSLGFSHPIVYQLPEGVKASVDKQTVVTVTGIDRQLVGEVAAGIRKLRPPEPYKGKGIRYAEEQVRRKAGKAGVGK